LASYKGEAAVEGWGKGGAELAESCKR